MPFEMHVHLAVLLIVVLGSINHRGLYSRGC
jgi:hypothetical protein